MERIQYDILLLINSVSEPATLEFFKDEKRQCVVILKWGTRVFKEKSFYFLHAFNEIRKEIEGLGARIGCNICRIDVVTNGMLSDMSDGTLGIVVTDNPEDLKNPETVNLFEPTIEFDKIISFEEQQTLIKLRKDKR